MPKQTKNFPAVASTVLLAVRATRKHQTKMNIQDQVQKCCARQSGRAVIQDIILRLRSRADALQKLSDMLPEKPTPEQDDALWKIACDIERR